MKQVRGYSFRFILYLRISVQGAEMEGWAGGVSRSPKPGKAWGLTDGCKIRKAILAAAIMQSQ